MKKLKNRLRQNFSHSSTNHLFLTALFFQSDLSIFQTFSLLWHPFKISLSLKRHPGNILKLLNEKEQMFIPQRDLLHLPIHHLRDVVQFHLTNYLTTLRELKGQTLARIISSLHPCFELELACTNRRLLNIKDNFTCI